MVAAMTRYLNLETWPRREAFEYFRGFDKPYFNLCAKVDASHLKTAVRASGVGSFSLAYHFVALRLANEIEPFRYRLHEGRVRILDQQYGGATVLRSDDSFGFAYMEPSTDWATFAEQAGKAVAAAQKREAGFEPRVGDDALVHFTTLPWVHFSSFSHARNWKREDSVPKISFGRADADGSRLWLPLSVEVHHALMDGLHVGRYFQRFEEVLADPVPWLLPK
jgi:chloramphenicol O-acetyltransferase type A